MESIIQVVLNATAPRDVQILRVMTERMPARMIARWIPFLVQILAKIVKTIRHSAWLAENSARLSASVPNTAVGSSRTQAIALSKVAVGIRH
jgi:hypothetical protein